MKTLLTSFVSGLVFALGLGISGMTRPVKVIGFLDFFGAWDASLACVMIGAIAVYFVAYRMSAKMTSPLLAPKFALPTRSDLDVKLILGAAIFGAGWGLGGFCPGPALVSLGAVEHERAGGALAALLLGHIDFDGTEHPFVDPEDVACTDIDPDAPGGACGYVDRDTRVVPRHLRGR